MASRSSEAPATRQHSRIAARRVTVAALLSAMLAATVTACGGKPGAPDGDSNATAGADAGATASVAPDPDVRTAVLLPVQGRHLILTEMRGMLTSVQGYVAAAARGDTAGMRAAASASGVAAARDMDPAMQQRLPAEFLRLGMSTHAAWDSLAADVSRGAPASATLGRLGTIMNNCVACHAQFRIDIDR